MKALVCILLLLETFVFVVQQQVDGGLNENEISQQISSEDGRQNPPQTDTLRAEASTDRQQYCDLGFPDIHAALRELTASVTEQKENIRELTATVTEQKGNIRELTATVTEQKGNIRELTATVTEQKENIRSLETQLREQQTFILEEMKKKNEDREIAFSASLMESGEGHTGPFTTEITLTYRNVFTNIGNAYNPITGIFTAPLKGAYMFRISVFSHGPTAAAVAIIKNGKHVVVADARQPQSFLNSSNGVVLILEVGDVVYPESDPVSSNDEEGQAEPLQAQFLKDVYEWYDVGLSFSNVIQVDGGLNENEISQQISSEDGRQNPPQTDTLRAEASTDRQQYCDLGIPDIHAALRELTASVTEQKANIRELTATVTEQKGNIRELTATVTEQKENIRALETQLRDEMNKKNEDREIAFSAGLMESGSRYIGPFPTEITITYRKVFTNIGNAYNPITGIFTAPLKGAYMFRINVHGNGGTPATAEIYKNGQRVVMANANLPNNDLNSSNGVVLILEVGDVVYTSITMFGASGNHYFTLEAARSRVVDITTTPEPPAFTGASSESSAAMDATSVFLVIMSAAYEDIKAFPWLMRLDSSLEDTPLMSVRAAGISMVVSTNNRTSCYGNGYLVCLGCALRFNGKVRTRA
ncbi:Complement C1q-like protein 4 [Anabarilius grahami]|uniref:Complement C1q-like protein 4 n=1 Tax=Anabarilius grahami TaxID=495550 RepID=A0A3N0Z4P7_ANAGA|nr:Complement C1q-like protein 4 [Anabarilius grahami]